MMADKTKIRVAVVEGDYAGLGLPLPLSLQLQCLNLKLSGALWFARASASGFSVSLYWPTADTVRGSVHVKARKNHKRPKCKQVSACVTNNQSVPSAPVVQSNSSQPSMCPNKEHLRPDYGSSDSENSCHSGSEQCSTDAGSPPTTSNNSSAVDLTQLALMFNTR